MIKYFKNFILCGEIDFLCLLCEECFQNTEDLEKHIRWEKHRKLMKKQSCLPRFRKDSIYQIGDFFYCEICNFATYALDSIKTHTAEESHKTNKQNPQNVNKTENKKVKWFSEFVTISKMVIPKEEWLGIANKYCWVCRTEPGRAEDHISSTSHMINLIHTEVVEVNNDYYRKICRDTAYCFECKKTVPFDQLSVHSSDHQKDRENKNNNNETNKLYNVDRDKNLATCKVCNETMELRFSNLYEHKKKFHKTEESNEQISDLFLDYDHGKLRAHMKMFGKENYIKLNSGGSKGYCSLCGTYISAHIANLKEHVSGARHRGNMEIRGLIKTNKKPEKVYYRTKPFFHLIRDIVVLKANGSAIIGKELMITAQSLTCLSLLEGNEKVRCHFCDELIATDDLVHYAKRHKDDVKNSGVVTTVSGEFIREIRPSLYHCGFCNAVYPSWRLMEKHLRSWSHLEHKRQSDLNFKELIVDSFMSYRQEQEDLIDSIDILD